MTKTAKFLLLLILVVIFAVAAYQIVDYWWYLAYFPFVSSLMTGLFHLLVLVLLGSAIYHAFTTPTTRA